MATSIGCRACHRRLVQTLTGFEPLVFTAPRSQRQVRSTIRSHPHPSTYPRSYSTQNRLRQKDKSIVEQETGGDDNAAEGSELAGSAAATSTTTPDSSIPWYLQVQPPAPPASSTILPLLAAQELPPLPQDPPPILHTMLKHLSISIGLDHLTLLDLRDLSPPSALGANLIMILGTARSTKHLNTSADRFCRWLRSTYNLRPYADGLLGRNELKLKLRRKNRKIKLAQTVGNTVAMQSAGGYDDGIGTGWICCNVGIVEGVEPVQSDEEETSILSVKDQERILEDEDKEYQNPPIDEPEQFKYAGFGSNQFAPRIVVQMFTEEKRAEMDLEGLWEARIVRRERKAEEQDRRSEEQDKTFKQGTVPGTADLEAAVQQIEAERKQVEKNQRDQSLLKDLGPLSSAAVG